MLHPLLRWNLQQDAPGRPRVDIQAIELAWNIGPRGALLTRYLTYGLNIAEMRKDIVRQGCVPPAVVGDLKRQVRMEMFNLVGLATRARLNARGKTLAAFDGRTVGVSRFSAHPRWEIHPHGDEFLQVIEGELELVLLLAKRTKRTTLRAGEATIVPKGVWHSPLPRGTVSLLHIADYRNTEVSDAEDPRADTSGR